MPKSLKDKREQNPYNIIVIGASGSGKTTLASTAHGKQYWFCFEDGLTSLLGKPELYTSMEYDTYLCTSDAQTAGDSWKRAFEKLTSLSKDLNGYDTIVIDSISSMTEVVLQAVQKNLRNFGKAPSHGLSNPYEPWTNLCIGCTNFVRGLLALPCNVVLIAHEISDKSDDGRMYWQIQGEGAKFPNWLPKSVDELWRMETTNVKGEEKYTLRTRGGRGFQAKSRMASIGNFKPEEVPNIADLVDRFNNNLHKE